MKPTSLFTTAIALLAVGLSAHEQYTAYDLGTLPTTYHRSAAVAINNCGVIVGSAYTNGTVAHAFCYTNGVMIDLGTVGGKFVSSFAMGLNDAGTIVGQCMSSNLGGYVEVRAFQFKSNTMDLLPLGGLGSWASGVNDADKIVGHVRTNSNNGIAFLYGGGAMTDLGVLGGAHSEAFGINSNGTIVGYSTIAGSSARHAFVCAGGVMSDLGTLGGASSSARAINGSGTIAGDGDVGTVRHAFRYAGGVMTDLGSLGGSFSNSFAGGINNHDRIVGYASTSSNPSLGTSRAFSYSDGIMTDLSPFLAKAGFIGNSRAVAINDGGWIVGQADVTGGSHAFLLVPDPAPLLHGILTNGLPQLTIEGDVGSQFAVEYTPDLSSSNNWVGIETNVLNTNPQVFLDATASGAPSRFYRVRLVP